MSETDDKRRDDDATAAEYVLRLLPVAERRQFEERLAADPALRDAVQGWEASLATLADEVADTAPPEAIRDRLMARLFGASPARTGLGSALAFWRGLALASTAAAVLLAAGLAYQLATPEAGIRYVAEIEGEDDAVRLVALYAPGERALRLSRIAGAPPEGRDFELWLIPPGETPISLGVLPEAARAEIAVPEGLRARIPGAVLAISDEPAGGSPTGQATGPVVAIGEVSEV